MSKEVSRFVSVLKASLFSLVLSASLVTGCAVAAKDTVVEQAAPASKVEAASAPKAGAAPMTGLKAGSIDVTVNSPADSVRKFYAHLRERRFREAMMMTNLKAAVEGLTDAEMDELKSDFEPLAQQVPAELQINGEIVTGNNAIVKIKLPNMDTGQPELMEIKLRKEGEDWLVLTGDEKAEEAVKKEGKNYFFVLKIDIHHVEAQKMIERIVKAQAVYALQNGGVFADFQTLISSGLLPEDAQSSVSTGYNFTMTVSSNNKKYYANAVPAVYGRTGKLSFLAECEGPDKQAKLKAEDYKGLPIKK